MIIPVQQQNRGGALEFFFFYKSDLRMLFMPRSWVFWQKGNSADKQDKTDWQVLGKTKRGEERLF